MPDEPTETPMCWRCSRYVVDEPGDHCDLCLDAIADELEDRLAPGQL